MAKPRRAKHAHAADAFYSPRQLDDQTARRQAWLDQAKLGSREALGELLTDYLPMMRSFLKPKLTQRC